MHQAVNHNEENMTIAARMGKFCRRAAEAAKNLSHEVFIRGRRLSYSVHEMSAEHPGFGPISFLAVSAALGLALTVTTLYSSSY